MNERYEFVVETKADAHGAATNLYAFAQARIADGRKVRMSAEEFDDDRSLRQNSYYWGLCLTEISEQARVGGQRYTTEAWHELFKRQFLGFEIKKVAVAGRKKLTVIRRLRSTTKLKVRAMSEYLEKVQAFATDDLGVRFSAPATADYEATKYKKRQAPAPKAEVKQLEHEHG